MKYRLTDKRIEEVVEKTVGVDALKIVRFLKGKKDISEFSIASRTREDIQIVRNILYRLHSESLVTYKRKKDKSKGWYISYWTFNRPRVKDLQAKLDKKQLGHYRQRLEVESANINAFFICPNACTRSDFNDAVQYQFRCTECGSLLNQQDNTKTISFLKEKIKEMEAAA